jgi:hypothetical protein
MKQTFIALTSAAALCCSFAFTKDFGEAVGARSKTGWINAQAGAPSGRGSTTGDPAASSSTSGTLGDAMRYPSGSGTSTSGGKDGNGDQGRDRMPESDKTVRPNNDPANK